jgi:inner membrane protein
MTQNQKSFFEKNAVMVKVAAIAFLTLMLLIPTAMIQSLVMERQKRLDEASQEIGSKWGYDQRVTGPLLTIPYYTFYLDKEQKQVNRTKHYVHFLPEDLKIEGNINPEVRYRGIFQVAVYNTELNFSGFFSELNSFAEGINTEIDWAGAFVTIGITDLRGIKEPIKFSWDQKEVSCEPGTRINEIVQTGVTVKMPLTSDYQTKGIDFSFKVSLNGSKSLNFVPVGKETNVSIVSSWASPSFDGAFLPESREVSEAGFTAKWRVLELNRNYPQRWIDSSYDLSESAFGVSLLLPMDKYQITERSMKYAILFIALTFTVFFFVEILRKLRVHPVQYILVGFGLVLFYLLLLSLSEQLSFGLAYLIASVGIVTMISAYSSSIFRSRMLTLLLASLMVVLYGFLYILLQMQDYALLMGSIGLFIILSAVMYLSRKIDWYSVGVNSGEE